MTNIASYIHCNIITITQQIFDEMGNGKQTDVAVMDFSKAFDKFDHQRLILKLKCIEVDNKTADWVHA